MASIDHLKKDEHEEEEVQLLRVVNNSKPKPRVLSPHIQSISLAGVISIRDDDDDAPAAPHASTLTPTSSAPHRYLNVVVCNRLMYS